MASRPRLTGPLTSSSPRHSCISPQVRSHSRLVAGLCILSDASHSHHSCRHFCALLAHLPRRLDLHVAILTRYVPFPFAPLRLPSDSICLQKRRDSRSTKSASSSSAKLASLAWQRRPAVRQTARRRIMSWVRRRVKRRRKSVGSRWTLLRKVGKSLAKAVSGQEAAAGTRSLTRRPF